MGQDAPTALTVSRLAVLVPASLHVLPQGFHLGTEPSAARRSQLALGSVSQQEKTLLLLADDLLGITVATTSADAVATRRIALLVQSLQIPTGKSIDLFLRSLPTVVAAVWIAARDPSHGVASVVDGIHAATVVAS